jgi:hypothetical protein
MPQLAPAVLDKNESRHLGRRHIKCRQKAATYGADTSTVSLSVDTEQLSATKANATALVDAKAASQGADTTSVVSKPPVRAPTLTRTVSSGSTHASSALDPNPLQQGPLNPPSIHLFLCLSAFLFDYFPVCQSICQSVC